MLKVVDFLCLWVLELFLLVLLLSEGVQVTTSVIFDVAGRSLCCYISANQQSMFQTSSPPFSLFLSLFAYQMTNIVLSNYSITIINVAH